MKRSVPLTDRMVRELKRWRLRTVYGDDEDLVFAHHAPSTHEVEIVNDAFGPSRPRRSS
jgi:hypothetical protein